MEVYVMRLRTPGATGRARNVASLVAAAGLAAGTAVAITSGVATAAPACQVQYSVNQWNTGFTAAITITNNGSAVTSWTLAYSYAGNQTLTQGWSGNWTQSGRNVTVTNASWNGSLATGGSTQIGANFSYSGTNTAPTAFTLNGVACNGAGTPPPTTPPPTTPPPATPPPATPPPTTPPPTTPPPTTPPPTTPGSVATTTTLVGYINPYSRVPSLVLTAVVSPSIPVGSEVDLKVNGQVVSRGTVQMIHGVEQ